MSADYEAEEREREARMMKRLVGGVRRVMKLVRMVGAADAHVSVWYLDTPSATIFRSTPKMRATLVSLYGKPTLSSSKPEAASACRADFKGDGIEVTVMDWPAKVTVVEDLEPESVAAGSAAAAHSADNREVGGSIPPPPTTGAVSA